MCLHCEAATRQLGDVFAKDKKKSPVVINNFQIALIPAYLKPALVPGLTINVLLLWLHMQKQTKKKKQGCCCLFMHLKMSHWSQYILDKSVFAAAEYLKNINVKYIFFD